MWYSYIICRDAHVMSQHTVIGFIRPAKSRQWKIMMASHQVSPMDAKNIMYGDFSFLFLIISIVFNYADFATVRMRSHRNPGTDTGGRELNIKGKTSLPGAEPGEGQNQSISPQNETKSKIHKTRQESKSAREQTRENRGAWARTNALTQRDVGEGHMDQNTQGRLVRHRWDSSELIRAKHKVCTETGGGD